MTEHTDRETTQQIERREVADGGILTYYPSFFPKEQADALLESLKKNIAWKQEQGRFGRSFPRLTALYADAGVTYTYSGVTYPSLVWSTELDAIRRRVVEAAGAPFNSVLLNYYRGGQDSIGFHADDEPELGVNPIVPSISLGAERRFVLRHKKSKERIEYVLRHGSLLVMGGTLQHHWQHAIPKTAAEVGERINLTFRNLLTEETRKDDQ
ncbi:MAG: alpha-ketoglutarate-dependent dioxygenase AlkB [Gemmataceae bacterium]|nr:alpha-ketoglutarate-dependent dioxygenase AlkB [Gemmataceae bacterium]